MKQLTFTSFIFLIFASTSLRAQHFETNFNEAQNISQKEGKSMMLVFSGSDWCKPCILLKQEILSSPSFSEFSQQNLVVLNLDFPFRKKNALPPAQQEHNEELAERYNPDGAFPLVLILQEDGSVAQRINFQPGMGAEPFIAQIASTISN